MNMRRLFTTILACLVCVTGFCITFPKGGNSVYTQRPDDKGAIYFTPEEFGFKADGKSDVTAALQTAIDKVKAEKNFGILFIPEGEYKISGTVTIPNAVRLIGYGQKRPVFYLDKNTPGFSGDQPKYMFWFTGGANAPGRNPQDAGAGTFYSAFSNVDFRIAKGNPAAVAIRSHFAQHSFINHCDFYMEDAYAGIDEVGNESEDLRFYGGQYGIVSARTSPGWPMMLVDTYFEGQSKAAIYSKEAGFDILGIHVKNTPVAFEMRKGLQDRLNLENAIFENISDAAVKISMAENTFCQVNLRNVECIKVKTLTQNLENGKTTGSSAPVYHVDKYVYGLCVEGIGTDPYFDEVLTLGQVTGIKKLAPELPALPPMSQWKNVADFGAKGDGVTDDTDAFERAIASGNAIYVPSGWYRMTRTLKMGKDTKFIGLHPFATQFVLTESEPYFSGFGSPQPVVETYKGGNNILNGIGIFAGAYNYRAVGCKWTAGESSFLNDVKFVGGHGTMQRPTPPGASSSSNRRASGRNISSPTSPVYATGKDLAWDTQYWSLWITDGGGGTIKDVWTADTYAASGLCMTDTDTPGRILAMSLEHHVRTEMVLRNVHNWELHAIQFEEEGTEGPDCHNMEMSICSNLKFSNVWMYRVIRAFMPKETGIRVWDSHDITINNMHSYTQIIPAIEFPVYDMSKGIGLPCWDYAMLHITGDEPSRREAPGLYSPQLVVSGFELASGAAADSEGNVYFCENRMRKIYRWDASTGKVTFVSDFPWKPFALGTDTQDNVIVIARYDPQPGLMVNGVQESVVPLPDDNPMYSGWGNGGWEVRAYSFSPKNPAATFAVLPLVESSTITNPEKVYHPSSRWRGDFTEIATTTPAKSFLGVDGKTAIPQTFDLFRCSAISEVYPAKGQPVFIANEMNKTLVRFNVGRNGALSDGKVVSPFSQYSQVVDSRGNIYVADGDVIVMDADGKISRRVPMPERPISLAVGGKNGELLLITTEKSLFAMRIR